MPVEKIDRLTRDELRAHLEKLFLFGENRERYGGSFREIRDEPNSQGVRIKYNPRNNETSLYSDADYERCVKWIADDLVFVEQWLKLGRVVVVPEGLFAGRAKLAEKAPRIAQYLQSRLDDLTARYSHDAASVE